jgi:hypothetical protein
MAFFSTSSPPRRFLSTGAFPTLPPALPPVLPPAFLRGAVPP